MSSPASIANPIDLSAAAAAPPARGRRRRVPAWLSASFWAVGDQGLFAVSNLALNVLLINWLPADGEAYGAFAVAFSVFLLIGTFHNAFLVEPMLVFGNANYAERLAGYLGTLLGGEVGFGLVAAALLGAGAVASYAMHSPSLAVALASMAVAAPFVLFQWLMRRACYVRLDPRRAALAGGLYVVLMTAGLLALRHAHHVTVPTACAVLAVASIASGAWLAIKEGVPAPWRLRDVAHPCLSREVAVDHWRYGRWAAAGGLVGYVPQQIYYLVLPLGATGLADSGSLRALTNLVMPLLQANAALCLLLLPRFVRARGTPAFRRTLRVALLVMVGVTSLYWLALGAFHAPVTHLLYGGRFDGETSLLWLIGFSPVLAAVFGVYHAVLEAHERPDCVFYAGLASAVAAGTVGVFLTVRMGLLGVAWASIVAMGVNAVVSWVLSRRVLAATVRGPAATEGA